MTLVTQQPQTPLDTPDIAVLRSLSPWRKLELARDLTRMAETLALAGLTRRMPDAPAATLASHRAIQRLPPHQQDHGRIVLEGIVLMTTPADPLTLALRVGALLDRLGIPYFIGGALAAIVHGEYRVTRDLDLVLDLTPRHVPALIAGLQPNFTLLPSDITDALAWTVQARHDRQQRASFCAYDTTTGFQLDIYLASGHPFEQAQFQRAVVLPIPGEPGGTLRVASAEDTILAKLEWYAITPSDRQWRDVQAVVRVQGDTLDRAYLHHWAAPLGITALLTRALDGEPPPPPPADARQMPLC